MSHLSLVFCTASGALANSGLQQEQGEMPLPPLTPTSNTRLSRPNTKSELLLKRQRRNAKDRKKKKQMSKKDKRILLAKKCARTIEKQKQLFLEEIEKTAEYAKKQRKLAIVFWKRWKEERQSSQDICKTLRQIDQSNIKDLPMKDILGEGTFGKCEKKTYRGHIVAVKYFKGSSSLAVEEEALNINSFDHPGLPFVFGVCSTHKPHAIIMEFYGIDGQCITMAKAARKNLLKEQRAWAKALGECSEALDYLHKHRYIHGDLKGDNILFNQLEGQYFPIIIDFGKMKKANCTSKHKLSSNEQEKYRRYYTHIAPEVVRGTHSKSVKSDIYALGQVISMVCHYTSFESLRQIAVQCIHGTPDKRPGLDKVISDLNHIANSLTCDQQ